MEPADVDRIGLLGHRFDALVIGTSAGGVEALTTLLPALPARCCAAVLVVLHLPRRRPSLLAEIFAPLCAVPVREAEDKEPIEPGTVYLAPPDYHLLVDAGPHTALSTDEAVNYSRPSIDVLFESAADLYGARCIGILLTGANADGAAGLARIQRSGGMAVVQDPSTAMASTMPESAAKIIRPDFTGSLDDIATLLRTLASAAPTCRPTTGHPSP